MKKLFVLFTCLSSLFAMKAQPAPDDFALGADISWVTEMESKGMGFADPTGRRMECTALMKEIGFDAIRLRVWVNPAETWNAKEDVLEKALRAKKEGMRLMVDFHYSDNWADPGKQRMPEQWKELSLEETQKALAEHTVEVLQMLKKHGVQVDWVQVGNETTNGMMWPMGKFDEHPEQYAALTQAGYEASKKIYPEAPVIIHLDCGNDLRRYTRIFDAMQKYQVDYDMIGMSVYPFWSQMPWKECIDLCLENMRILKEKYGKDIMVCETGMPVDDEEEGYRMLSYQLETFHKSGLCEGVFYWEPEAPARYNGGYMLGSFKNDRPTKALQAFTDMARSLGRPVYAQPEYSTAGFFEMEGTGRKVYSMNPAWRFHKGEVEGAEKMDFEDDAWKVVNLPDGMEYLPLEASGCINYQGPVWYRKHFTPSEAWEGKRLVLHFEGIMGKSRIYLNGKLIQEHFGGYLPVVCDLSGLLRPGEDNVIAVWADNSNDPSYPPGKEQEVLDYTYAGGIYRDCWMIAHNEVYITDPNWAGQTAGGGLFVHYGQVSEEKAEVLLDLEVRNSLKKPFRGSARFELVAPDGQTVAVVSSPLKIASSSSRTVSRKVVLNDPELWSPAFPNLYQLKVTVHDHRGHIIDGYRQKIGIRSIEFKAKEGFWLNGKPYGKPVIGVNRHQDFAVVGNAVANSMHWRDALKLKDLGLDAIRNAHCPQDPAFMDACDALGLLVIENTPGWQFWNEDPIFAERVYDDIRNLVRRDRNHACVWMWEPILNETWYPADFAARVKQIVEEEYPYPYCYSASDDRARGHENYEVQFSHPKEEMEENVTYFTREWGDNVDDWNSHNSTSRVARNWGEGPMKVQAQHYADPVYDATCFENLYQQPAQHVGGCLWHSFDHQRGYHPDPFYGGVMDVFRQPKYAYYMFMAQRPAAVDASRYGCGPMVYIAHEMTPFSGEDVTVYSNCEEVRLTFLQGGETQVYHRPVRQKGMPSPVITFKGVYDFMKDKKLSYAKRSEEVWMLAEGLIDGKVVATHKVMPARRPSRLLLWVDANGIDLQADGSDFVTVIAAVADKNGNIKRLNNYTIDFDIEGEGVIMGDSRVLADPAPVRWGTAPVLVRSTMKPGQIKVKAKVLFEGSQMPLSAELVFNSRPVSRPSVYDAAEAEALRAVVVKHDSDNEVENLKKRIALLEKQLNEKKLQEVEKQQDDFGETK